MTTEVSVKELQPGDVAEWTVYFDPTHHGTLGDHNHSIMLYGSDPDKPPFEVKTVANVLE